MFEIEKKNIDFDSSKYRFNLTIFQKQKVKNIFIEFLKKKTKKNACIHYTGWDGTVRFAILMSYHVYIWLIFCRVC